VTRAPVAPGLAPGLAPRLAAVFAALLAAGLLLTGCSTGQSSSTAAAPPTPVLTSPTPAAPTRSAKPAPPPPPSDLVCYRLTYDDALAPTSSRATVPCTGPHTAFTFYVGRYATHLAVDSPQVHRLVSTVCPRRFATFVGGSVDDRRLSLLRTIWFTPTLTEADAGARWFRCEAIAIKDDQHLAPLTGRLAGVLGKPTARTRFGLCGTAEPGTPGFGQRICSAGHSWRALRTVDLKPGRYPGVDAVKAAGQQPCRDAGRAAASDPLSYQWSYQWPTLQQWRAGQTYGVCWAPSS
jgi:hypothetical protein